MSDDFIQLMRYKLQKRMRRLNSTTPSLFHFVNIQFYRFITTNEIFSNLIADYEERWPRLKIDIDDLFNGAEALAFDNEEENAIAGFLVLKRCAESDDERSEVLLGLRYGKRESEDALELYKDLFIEPLYEFLDENLDSSKNLLNLLVRYKRTNEWFKKNAMLQMFKENTQNGEAVLASNLFEYLYSQGINFYIEPQIDTGRVDLISDQVGDERLLIDAKIYDPESSRGKSYIAKGYNQMLTYAHEYNEPVAYLVIFQTGGNDLSINFKMRDNKIPFILHDNKIVHFVKIDLRDLPSASKRGLHTTSVITEHDLIVEIEE